MAAIHKLGCGGERPFQNTRQNILGQMIYELTDGVKRFGAMRATRRDDAVWLICEGIEIMLAEF